MLQYFLNENKHSIFMNDKLPQLLYLCNTETMQQNFPRALHKHEKHLEIVFIVKGRGNHLIGNKKYQTKEGDILIFNQNVLHDESAELHSNMVVYCCGIKELYLKGMEKNRLIDIDIPAVIPSGKWRDPIEKTLDIMFQHVLNNPKTANENCRYLLASLLTIITKLPKSHLHTIIYARPSLITQVKNYIDTCYWENITLNEIASRFNINTYYLSHLFKQETGFSPIQYMIRRRIGEAQSLLINTRYSITQIASQVGYDNANYFSTLFSKMVGVSPRAYRDSWIGKLS